MVAGNCEMGEMKMEKKEREALTSKEENFCMTILMYSSNSGFVEGFEDSILEASEDVAALVVNKRDEQRSTIDFDIVLVAG